MLSVDVEEYFHVSNFDTLIDRRRWDSLPSRVEDSTRRLLDLFDAFGQRATFFTLGWIAERKPRLVREIAERGHEVGCHGYAHELVYELGESAFRRDLRRARSAIEDATGVRPLSYRAPSYSIRRDSLWGLRILAELGFRHDSSIFPVRHPRYGIPEFRDGLVEIDFGDGLSIVEFPLSAVRVGAWSLPVTGGAYLRLLPFPIFRWGFGRVARADRPGVLVVHPWEIDPDQPRLRTSWDVRIRHYRNLERTEERLSRLLRDHRFGPLGEVRDARAASGTLPQRKLAEILDVLESERADGRSTEPLEER